VGTQQSSSIDIARFASIGRVWILDRERDGIQANKSASDGRIAEAPQRIAASIRPHLRPAELAIIKPLGEQAQVPPISFTRSARFARTSTAPENGSFCKVLARSSWGAARIIETPG
jgi:hypothetical protein